MNNSFSKTTLSTLFGMAGISAADMAKQVRERMGVLDHEKQDLQNLLSVLEGSPAPQVQKVAAKVRSAVNGKTVTSTGRPSKMRIGLTDAIVETVRLSKKPLTALEITENLREVYGVRGKKKMTKFASSVYGLCAQLTQKGVLSRDKEHSSSYAYRFVK